MNNKLEVQNVDGQKVVIEVIDIIENTTNNKQYICYSFNGMEEVFVSALVEKDDSYSLEMISEEEKKAVEQELTKNVEE